METIEVDRVGTNSETIVWFNFLNDQLKKNSYIVLTKINIKTDSSKDTLADTRKGNECHNVAWIGSAYFELPTC